MFLFMLVTKLFLLNNVIFYFYSYSHKHIFFYETIDIRLVKTIDMKFKNKYICQKSLQTQAKHSDIEVSEFQRKKKSNYEFESRNRQAVFTVCNVMPPKLSVSF